MALCLSNVGINHVISEEPELDMDCDNIVLTDYKEVMGL
jgi:hypothetical protein